MLEKENYITSYSHWNIYISRLLWHDQRFRISMRRYFNLILLKKPVHMYSFCETTNLWYYQSHIEMSIWMQDTLTMIFTYIFFCFYVLSVSYIPIIHAGKNHAPILVYRIFCCMFKCLYIWLSMLYILLM